MGQPVLRHKTFENDGDSAGISGVEGTFAGSLRPLFVRWGRDRVTLKVAI